MFFLLKKIFFISLFATLSFATASASDNPYESKFPIKEGVIHYTITGSTKGTQTTYIRDYGKERVIYKNTQGKIMQKHASADEVIMIDESWTYHIDLKTKVAIKEPTLNSLLKELFNKLSPQDQQVIIAKSTKTFLNLSCRKESLAGVTKYLSKEGNILLHSETGIMGYKVKTTATDIEKTAVKPSLFALPKGLKIIEKEANIEKASRIIQALLKKESLTSSKTKVDYNKIIQDGIKSLDF